MFDLTTEEKKVLLFIISVALLGLAIDMITKSLPPARKVLILQPHLAKVNLNKVSLAELLDTRCVPEKLARSIISCRDAQGGFKSIEELRTVKGVGARRYEKLKGLFYME